MKKTRTIGLYLKLLFSMLYSVILLFATSYEVFTQEYPPRAITVTATSQNLSFGAFYHGAIGGSVTINSGGVRSALGDIVLLNLGYAFSAALYNVVANPGTLISVLNGPDVSLPGSNGGSLTLQMGLTNPVSPFVTSEIPPTANPLYIGGKLTVGGPLANPPGSYSGTFDVTFIQE